MSPLKFIQHGSKIPCTLKVQQTLREIPSRAKKAVETKQHETLLRLIKLVFTVGLAVIPGPSFFLPCRDGDTGFDRP
jgi:hypothetical protein